MENRPSDVPTNIWNKRAPKATAGQFVESDQAIYSELSGGSNSCETKRGLQEEVLVKILSKTCTVTPQDKAKVCASHPP